MAKTTPACDPGATTKLIELLGNDMMTLVPVYAG